MIELVKQMIETILGQGASDVLRVRLRARRMNSGIFTEPEIAFLDHVLKDGDIALDAGAYDLPPSNVSI